MESAICCWFDCGSNCRIHLKSIFAHCETNFQPRSLNCCCRTLIYINSHRIKDAFGFHTNTDAHWLNIYKNMQTLGTIFNYYSSLGCRSLDKDLSLTTIIFSLPRIGTWSHCFRYLYNILLNFYLIIITKPIHDHPNECFSSELGSGVRTKMMIMYNNGQHLILPNPVLCSSSWWRLLMDLWMRVLCPQRAGILLRSMLCRLLLILE